MTVSLRAPYQTDYARSVSRGMERGKMPQTLEGLLRWYVVRIGEELPDRLHRNEVWHDRVSTSEMGDGIQAQGGSHLGAPAWASLFRRLLEGSPSQVDEDGYYTFPITAALSRMERRHPLMTRCLFRLAMSKGDWQSLADSMGYPHEFMAVYTEAALQRLWRTTYDKVT